MQSGQPLVRDVCDVMPSRHSPFSPKQPTASTKGKTPLIDLALCTGHLHAVVISLATGCYPEPSESLSADNIQHFNLQMIARLASYDPFVSHAYCLVLLLQRPPQRNRRLCSRCSALSSVPSALLYSVESMPVRTPAPR